MSDGHADVVCWSSGTSSVPVHASGRWTSPLEWTNVSDTTRQPDLLVFHRDGASARRTIERLSRAGIDGAAISLIGPAEVVTAGRYGDRQTDRGSAFALGGRVLRGGAIGAVPGALFGGLLMAVFAEPTVIDVGAGALGGAGFAAGIGVLTALLHAPTMVTAWERTFSPLVPGGVVVGVAISSARARARADRALRTADVERVVEVDDLDELPEGPIAPVDPAEEP